MRAFLFIVSALALVACKKDPQPAVVDAGPAKTAHAASPVDQPVHEGSTTAPTDKPSQDGKPLAEVEVLGKLTGVPKEAELRVAISRKACAAADAQLDLYGQEVIRNAGPSSDYFIEVFAPQGSSGWVCAWALAGDQVVAFGAADAKNPIKMEGSGEVMFPDTLIELRATGPSPRPAGL